MEGPPPVGGGSCSAYAEHDPPVPFHHNSCTWCYLTKGINTHITRGKDPDIHLCCSCLERQLKETPKHGTSSLCYMIKTQLVIGEHYCDVCHVPDVHVSYHTTVCRGCFPNG